MSSPTDHAKNPHLLPLLPRSTDRPSPASHPSPTALSDGAQPRIWLPPARRASRQRPAVLPTRSLSPRHSSPPTPLPCRPPSPVEPLASGKHRRTRGGYALPPARRPFLPAATSALRASSQAGLAPPPPHPTGPPPPQRDLPTVAFPGTGARQRPRVKTSRPLVGFR